MVSKVVNNIVPIIAIDFLHDVERIGVVLKCVFCYSGLIGGIDHMVTTTTEALMAADKAESRSLKMPLDVLETAKIVAALKSMSMTDLVADILRPALAEMEKEEFAKRTALGVKGKKPAMKRAYPKRTEEEAK
jgi:hypothetical protein